jgi:sugar lactone lactonase YvrE
MAFGQKKPDDTVVLGRCPRLRWEQAFGQTLAGLPNSQLRSLVLLVVCVAWTGLAAGELPPTSSVTPELYATGFAFAEGPTFDLQGNLYAVNYRELGTIGMVTPDGTASIWCDLNKASPVEGRKVQANGLKIDSEGRLIVADAGGGRVLRISPDGRQVEVLADRCEGVRFNSINDVALDRLGNIFFTDPGTSSAENPVGAVYRYDIGTKKTMRLAAGLAYPNGIGVTPDQQHLCVAESDRYRLLIFPLDAAAGQVGDPRVLIDFPQETRDGIQGGKFAPDGFVFDALGRLFVAMWVGGVINVVEVPSGTLVRQYDAGGTQATNCHFHGTYLYTTVAAKEAVFRLKLGVEGHEYWALRSTGRQEGQVPVRVKE